MSRLEDAQKRLERALARLEAAADQAHRDNRSDDDGELARALDAERRRSASLEAREREIGKRLDAAIGRLRAVLDT